MLSIEKLREHLIAYLKKSALPSNVVASELYNVEHAGCNELINIAENYGFDVNDFVKKVYLKS